MDSIRVILIALLLGIQASALCSTDLQNCTNIFLNAAISIKASQDFYNCLSNVHCDPESEDEIHRQEYMKLVAQDISNQILDKEKGLSPANISTFSSMLIFTLGGFAGYFISTF